jgi:hypothetical protein
MTLHINIIVVQPLSNHFLNLLISLIVIGAPPSACDLMFFTLTDTAVAANAAAAAVVAMFQMAFYTLH